MKLRCWARVAIVAAGAWAIAAADAKTFRCVGADGKPVISDRGCPVVAPPPPHPDGPLPAKLKADIDENDGRLAALATVLRNLGQDAGDVDARFRCERDTLGKRWHGAAPAASACDRPACAGP